MVDETKGAVLNKRSEVLSRVELANKYVGKNFAKAARYNWVEFFRPVVPWDFEDMVSCFRQGIHIKVPMNTGVNDYHQLFVDSNGNINFLDHPGFVFDVDTELVLHYLGGNSCPCIVSAIFAYSNVQCDSDSRFIRNIVDQVRVLRTAMLWANSPDYVWDPDFGDTRYKWNITPDIVKEWGEDGWEPDVALKFQQQFVKKTLANKWKEFGNTSIRAANLAALGENPEDEKKWVEAGFTVSKSAKWRSTGLSPDEALEWENAQVPPTLVQNFKRVSEQNNIELSVLQDWSKNGIQARDVLRWIVLTQNFDEVYRMYSNNIRSNIFSEILIWNQKHPNCFIDVDTLIDYHNYHFNIRLPNVLWFAIRKGVSPQMWAKNIAGFDDFSQYNLLRENLKSEIYRQGKSGLVTSDIYRSSVLKNLETNEQSFFSDFTKGFIDMYSLTILVDLISKQI